MTRNRLALCILTGALTLPVLPGMAQDHDQKSPDLQQQSHPQNNPSAERNEPNGTAAKPSTSQSPDTEQEKSTQRNTRKVKNKRNKNDAKQVHGTPHPESASQK